MSKTLRAWRSKSHRRCYMAAQKAGWSVRLTGSGHVRLTAPPPSTDFITLSMTAYDGKNGLNTVKTVLRRNGVSI